MGKQKGEELKGKTLSRSLVRRGGPMNFERFKSISNLDFKELLLKVQTNAKRGRVSTPQVM